MWRHSYRNTRWRNVFTLYSRNSFSKHIFHDKHRSRARSGQMRKPQYLATVTMARSLANYSIRKKLSFRCNQALLWRYITCCAVATCSKGVESEHVTESSPSITLAQTLDIYSVNSSALAAVGCRLHSVATIHKIDTSTKHCLFLLSCTYIHIQYTYSIIYVCR